MKGYEGVTWKFFAAALILLAGVLFLESHRHPAYGRFAMAKANTGDYKGGGLQAEKPQIDKVLPERVETATFALG